MWQCMQVADKENCSSIAFPAFGTGQLKYPLYEVAKVMFETVDMYGKQTPSTQIKEVKILVYFDDERNSKARFSLYFADNWMLCIFFNLVYFYYVQNKQYLKSLRDPKAYLSNG